MRLISNLHSSSVLKETKGRVRLPIKTSLEINWNGAWHAFNGCFSSEHFNFVQFPAGNQACLSVAITTIIANKCTLGLKSMDRSFRSPFPLFQLQNIRQEKN